MSDLDVNRIGNLAKAVEENIRLRQQLAIKEARINRFIAADEAMQEQLAECERERDELMNVLKMYDKLTSHDGWYADKVKAAIAKVGAVAIRNLEAT